MILSDYNKKSKIKNAILSKTDDFRNFDNGKTLYVSKNSDIFVEWQKNLNPKKSKSVDLNSQIDILKKLASKQKNDQDKNQMEMFGQIVKFIKN